jgi:hypothetical protein
MFMEKHLSMRPELILEIMFGGGGHYGITAKHNIQS